MSYRIRTDTFEGPFDLLLYLVSRQKVDIGAISITDIADQYLAEMEAMGIPDLDVASDFLLVASTLLEIKASSLIPNQDEDIDEQLEELGPSEARDILVQRLVTYKQFKNAAAALNARYEHQGLCHPRVFGPAPDLATLAPDWLEGVTLDGLAFMCAQMMGRRNRFLLDSEHIAAQPIPVELHVRAIHSRVKNEKRVRFSQIIANRSDPALIVVTFLAVLELYKRRMVDVVQNVAFGDMDIEYIEGSGELFLEGDEGITSVEEG